MRTPIHGGMRWRCESRGGLRDRGGEGWIRGWRDGSGVGLGSGLGWVGGEGWIRGGVEEERGGLGEEGWVRGWVKGWIKGWRDRSGGGLRGGLGRWRRRVVEQRKEMRKRTLTTHWIPKA